MTQIYTDDCVKNYRTLSILGYILAKAGQESIYFLSKIKPSIIAENERKKI